MAQHTLAPDVDEFDFRNSKQCNEAVEQIKKTLRQQGLSYEQAICVLMQTRNQLRRESDRRII